jgi:hypothetical protein
VEQGVAPESIVVTQDNGTRTPTGNERILCPWPQQPTYVGPTGSGAENNPANWKAANFACQASVFAHHHHGHDDDDHGHDGDGHDRD